MKMKLLAAAFAIAFLCGFVVINHPKKVTVYEHVVRDGEAPATIAQKYAPDRDWRKVVFDSGITGYIHPGQKLLIVVKD